MVTGKRPVGESDRAQVFNALGDPTREAIVRLLADGPLPVHQLASRFPMSRPAVSRHLRLLKEAGIVSERRRGRERAYYLRREALAEISEWVAVMRSAGGAVADGAVGGGAVAAVARPRRRRRKTAKKEVTPSAESKGLAAAKGDNWKAW